MLVRYIYIYIYGAFAMMFLAGKSLEVQLYTVCIYMCNSDQPSVFPKTNAAVADIRMLSALK
jgi:hypothetical protein